MTRQTAKNHDKPDDEKKGERHPAPSPRPTLPEPGPAESRSRLTTYIARRIALEVMSERRPTPGKDV